MLWMMWSKTECDCDIKLDLNTSNANDSKKGNVDSWSDGVEDSHFNSKRIKNCFYYCVVLENIQLFI